MNISDFLLGLAAGQSGGGGIEEVEWHQCPEAVREYLAYISEHPYNASDYTYTYITDYAPSTAEPSNSKPVAETVSGDLHRNEVPSKKTPFASTNKAGTLKPLDRVRMINTTLANGTYYPLGNNTRDLGGWDCYDGSTKCGTVEYGKLFRGGECNPVDKDLMVNQLGIKTEINLLPTNKQQFSASPWDIDLIKNPGTLDIQYWYDISVSARKELWLMYLKGIIDSVIHNKSVYFHCGQGADKTGTVACILLAILGVSQSDIDTDYELTSFSPNGSNGAVSPYACIRGRTYENGALGSFINGVKSYPLNAMFGGVDSLRNRAISWTMGCGITLDEINAFRVAVIDGNPEIFISVHSITNTLTHCSNSNTASEVSHGTAYSGTLTPASGYAMSTITVKMDGVDITSTAVSGNSISIASVTGDVVITAIATSTSRLPAEYQEVEYVGSWDAYFVTDFDINSLDIFTVKWKFKNNDSTSNNRLFGSSDNPNTGSRFLHRNAGLTINSASATTAYTIDLQVSAGGTAEIEAIANSINNTIAVYKDGSLLSNSAFIHNKNFDKFGVFCNNYAGNPSGNTAYADSRIYYLQIIDGNGNDVLNLVPCYRKADDVIGMYDLVSERFYTNQNTATTSYFVKGSNV